MQFRGPQLFFKKRGGGSIPRRIVPTWNLYAFTDKLAIRLWMEGLDLNVILIFLPIWFAIWQPVHRRDSQSQNLSTALPTLGCHALHVWLAESSRVPTLWRHDHNIDDQNMVVLLIIGIDLPCLWKKIYHQNTMLTRWKVCKFKDEDIKILCR